MGYIVNFIEIEACCNHIGQETTWYIEDIGNLPVELIEQYKNIGNTDSGYFISIGVVDIEHLKEGRIEATEKAEKLNVGIRNQIIEKSLEMDIQNRIKILEKEQAELKTQ